MQQVAYREQTGYPVQFSVDYPDRPLNRLSTAFRPILVLPIATLVRTLSGGVLFFAPLLLILFHRKYPRWWFDWNLELQRFTNRVDALIELCAENNVAFVPFFAIGAGAPRASPFGPANGAARTSSPKSPASTEPPRRTSARLDPPQGTERPRHPRQCQSGASARKRGGGRVAPDRPEHVPLGHDPVHSFRQDEQRRARHAQPDAGHRAAGFPSSV